MGSGILKTCRQLSVFTLLGGGIFIVAFLLTTVPARAAAGINQEVNFQGRLLNSQGAAVPDGFYNIEFNIYQDGDGLSANDATPAGSPGTLLWTEDYVDNNASAGVEVQNGFLSVQLGSICPFTGGSCEGHSNSAVNWNSNTLWLSMNVAGDNNACTTFNGASCAADGEMLPMKRLSSSVYALNANLLGGLSSAEFVQLGQGLQTDATANTSIAINKTGSGDLLDLQNNGADAFTLNGTGDATFGANADHTLSVATAAASTAGSALTISSGAAGTGASALAGGNLTITAGAGGGTDGNGGNLALDAGAPNGLGSAGDIAIGTNNATNITIGNTSTTSQAKTQAGHFSTTVTDSGVSIAASVGTSTAFQVQNAGGDVVFTVDTSSNTGQGQVVLGKAGTNNGALVFESSTAGGGAVTLQAPTIALASSYGLTLPTAAPSGSGQCLQTSSASQLTFGACGTTGSFIFNQTSQQTGANFNIDGTGIAATELETATLDAVSSGALNIGLTSGGIATQINLNQNVQVSGDQTFANGANRKVSVAAAASGNGNDLTIAAGDGASSGGNGGNLILQGGMGTGSGTTGLVVLGTPTFSATTNDANCYTGGALVASTCTVAQSTVDNSSTVVVGFSATEQTAFLPDPTNITVGRVFYITAANGSKDFTLSVNGGGTGNEVAMRQNTSATMVWNGTAWAAAGASSSTTLQAAYDNTLQSAGGAELVVSHTSNTDGLTIRDSTVNPVNGTLVSVQNNSAATLLAINNNVTEYSTDSGAEIAGGTSNTFPASTWGAIGAASVSRYTTVGDFIATGQGSVSVGTTTAAEDGVEDTLSGPLTANQHYNVSFAARLGSGTFTDMNVYYSVDGTAASVSCTDSHAVTASIWTKVNCTFIAPSSGITANNAILIRQTSSGTARSFYIDNLSVTIAADFNLATDGGVDDSTNFSTNWTSVSGATVTRSTTVGNDASDSAEVDTTGSGQGVRNLLAIDPLPSNLYRVTVYAGGATAAFDNFTVSYSRDGGTSFVNCADYNTQTVSSSQTNFTEITCYINTDGTTATNPHVYFTQTDGTARTFYVDTFSMTLATATTPNVQIGGGVNGGPVTLLTLDRAASAPIASNNDAFLGSLYYDTTLGELQCYEADGWGSCGSSPNTVVTISPEYTNSVMHGTGVGTMTSDFCSDTLGINNGTGGQPTVCGTNETFNFYRWTSPQASAQTYSIYVTYQLPDTFKSFASGQTNITGRTDSSNATVQYKVYRDSPSAGLIPCGSTVAVSTGSVSSWQTGVASGAADPSTCGFLASDSIVFEIDMTASQDADAYVSNLNFTFSHK